MLGKQLNDGFYYVRVTFEGHVYCLLSVGLAIHERKTDMARFRQALKGRSPPLRYARRASLRSGDQFTEETLHLPNRTKDAGVLAPAVE